MAAALIHRPDLYLLDEPFEGVDAVGARLMKDILLDQVRQGATIFLTSHVLEVVERLCDRVADYRRGPDCGGRIAGTTAGRLGDVGRHLCARGGRFGAQQRITGLALGARCSF